MPKVLPLIIFFIFVSGCDTANAERTVLRFALVEGFKSGCEENSECIEKVDNHSDQCLTDADLDALIAAPDSEYDKKVYEISNNVFSCIQNQ